MSNPIRSFLTRFSVLQVALGVSLAAHAVVLSIKFIDPEAFNRAFNETPLEVILVNAKSSVRPDVAQAIAQANLDGGGNADAGLAKSPLPAAAIDSTGDAAVESKKRIDDLLETQEKLLATVRTALAQPRQEFKSLSEEAAAQAEDDRRKQLMKLLAEIETRISEENKRPKKRFISPATREAVYAVYYDQLKRKVEAKGTENFPEIAGQKIYGELTMVILVDRSGRLLKTEIIAPSGNRKLDRMAESIVQSAGPFGAFSAEMRREADQVEVVSRFKFARDETLKASLEAQQAAPASALPSEAAAAKQP